jgi:hypothetical protein
MARVSPEGDWWRRVGANEPEPPVQVRLDRADRGDQGGRFVAPFRGAAGDGASHPQGHDDLDGLLEEVGCGMGAWTGNGIFDEESQQRRGEGAAGGPERRGLPGSQAAAGRRRRGKRVGADAPAAGLSRDHQDPSADVPAVFGGTASGADAGAGDGSGGGGLTEDEVQTIRKLKEALQLTKRKLDRAREDVNNVEDELEVREKEAADLRWEKEAADAERDRMRREYEAAQKAAKKRSMAAHRRASAMTRAGVGGDEDEEDVLMDDLDEDEKSYLARLYSRWLRWWRRLAQRVRRRWVQRNPVRRAVVAIDQKFGSSTSVYFSFVEGLLKASFLHFLIVYLPLILVPHAISQTAGAWDPAASPHVLANFYFSAFTTTVRIFYVRPSPLRSPARPSLPDPACRCHVSTTPAPHPPTLRPLLPIPTRSSPHGEPAASVTPVNRKDQSYSAGTLLPAVRPSPPPLPPRIPCNPEPDANPNRRRSVAHAGGIFLPHP